MISKKPQTIQGFLSPTKLLSVGSRNIKQGSKGPRSPIHSSSQKKGSDSRYTSQNQSFLNTSRQTQKHNLYQIPPIEQKRTSNISRLTGQNNILNEQPKYESEGNIPFTFDQNTRSNFNELYKKVSQSIQQQDNFSSSQRRVLSQVNKQRWDTEKSSSPFSRQSKLKTQSSANYKQNGSSKHSLSEGINSAIKSNNPQVMTVQCYELIRKLSKIKEDLQLQILELQTLLDNTSKYMENMDEQFDKIKDSILSYTARCLDSAFAEYKQNMVEWQKYEDFERKSLSMLTEINEYIYNEEQNLSTNKNLSHKQISSIALELDRQIKYYRQFTEEIRKIRDQCVGMRPTLSEDRVKAFQKGLAIMCSF